MAKRFKYNTTVTIDGSEFCAYTGQVGFAALSDSSGLPNMGTLGCTMEFSADMHDTTALRFEVVRKLFQMSTSVSGDKVKPIKIEFWADDNHDDSLCSLSFNGWISSWTVSTGGDTNRVLSITIQPMVEKNNYYNITIGN